MRPSSRPPSPLPSRRPALQVLWSDPYLRLRYDPSTRFVLLTRRPTPYPSIAVFHQVFDMLSNVLDSISKPSYRLVIDSRDALSRNDEAFEAALASRRVEIMRGFARVAILVRTSVGKLQVGRHAQQDGLDVFVSSDIAELGAELGLLLDDTLFLDPERTV